MRRLAALILTILYQIGMGSGITSDQTPAQVLGIPAADSYSEAQVRSRVPWDMIIVDDKLYLGGGDYGDNTGPVDIWCCDLSTGEWSVSGTLDDEAIGKFIAIDGRVYAPGFDSKGSWEYGNYHWLEDGQWHTNGQLPNAVHNFDIVQYDGKLFFGLGTENGTTSPVKESADDGVTFRDVPFFKDGVDFFAESRCSFSRVYDFFVTESGLYCMLLPVTDGKASSYEFYRYIDGTFYYVSTYDQIGLNIKLLKQEPISAKVTFQGSCYIAAGYLTRTTDFQSAERIVLPRNEMAVDLLTDGERLYVLSAEPNNNGWTTRIYVYIYNSFLYPVASFDSENLPVSFVKDGRTFYVGLNSLGPSEDISGSIYQLTISELTQKVIDDCI